MGIIRILIVLNVVCVIRRNVVPVGLVMCVLLSICVDSVKEFIINKMLVKSFQNVWKAVLLVLIRILLMVIIAVCPVILLYVIVLLSVVKTSVKEELIFAVFAFKREIYIRLISHKTTQNVLMNVPMRNSSKIQIKPAKIVIQ